MQSQSQSYGAQVDSAIKAIPRGLAIRGVVAIVFGIAILVWPNVSLSALVLLVGAFATVDGVISLIFAFSPMPTSTRLVFIINGIAGIGVGVITVVNPSITELALLYVVGAWAIILGVMQFVVAWQAPVEGRFRVLAFLYGVVAVAFGVIMFIKPGTGALGLLSLISAFAIITGVTLIAAAYDFRTASQEVKDQVRNTMTGSPAR